MASRAALVVFICVALLWLLSEAPDVEQLAAEAAAMASDDDSLAASNVLLQF